MKLKSDRKNYIIMGLCAILLVMSIGYAAFSSMLSINGTASLTDSFCVGFDNTKTDTYVASFGDMGGTLPTGSMSYSGTACSAKYVPNASLAATFKVPGDRIEYTLTIANKSTFTVAIKSLLVENQSIATNTIITKGNIKYVIEMPLSTTLAANEETTMKVTAMFQTDTNVTGQYSGESQTINVKINAEQDDGNGGIPPFTGTIYRINHSAAKNGDSIKSSVKWCYTFYGSQSCRDTKEECDSTGFSCSEKVTGPGEYTTDASTLNKNVYLKHDIVDDIITASYVCFVYNNDEHCLKGGINESSSDSKPVFEANMQIMRDYQAFYNLPDGGDPGCDFTATSSNCNGDGSGFRQISAGMGGWIYFKVRADSQYSSWMTCEITGSTGESYC